MVRWMTRPAFSMVPGPSFLEGTTFCVVGDRTISVGWHRTTLEWKRIPFLVRIGSKSSFLAPILRSRCKGSCPFVSWSYEERGWILGSPLVTCTDRVCPTWRTSDTKWNTKLRRKRLRNERSRTAQRIQVRDIQEQTKGAETCVWHWTDERDGTRPTHPRWLYTSERIQHYLLARVETRHTSIRRWEKITTKSWGCKKEPAKTK